MEFDPSAKELPSLIGNTIRQHRTNHDISQEVLAERSNLTSTYIGQLERGCMNPTIGTLYRITSALDITLLDLFKEIDESKSGIDSPELFRFIQYVKNLPPERISSIHQFLKDMES